jgi:hypothetical protein
MSFSTLSRKISKNSTTLDETRRHKKKIGHHDYSDRATMTIDAAMTSFCLDT